MTGLLPQARGTGAVKLDEIDSKVEGAKSESLDSGFTMASSKDVA